jgi:type IV pilus assembly protein PilA
MAHTKTRGKILPFFIKSAVITASLFLSCLAGHAQQAPVRQQSESSWSQELKKYPGLTEELARLVDKLQHDIQFPGPRNESNLLPLLPASTLSYGAFPNYGDAISQLLTIFRQELKESAVLRDWWQHGQLATTGPMTLDALNKFSQLHQYLGSEIVMSSAMDGKDPGFLVVAEVRKPGLQEFLQQTVVALSGKSKSTVRILNPQELATTEDNGHSNDLVVLVRPDFVVASLNLATLRAFNARLTGTSREFSSTPFGQRVSLEYQSGLTILGAADLHNILEQMPPAMRQNPSFQRSGFADVKYLVWEHKRVSGQSVSQGELSFNAPRHGAASWLASPRNLGSLDFVSPKAAIATTIVLGNFSQIFDDLKDLAGPSNAASFAMLPQFEKSLNLSLKDDLLNLLGGEITIELDTIGSSKPDWRAILAVKDSDHLQRTLSKLLATTNFAAEPVEQDGVTFHSLQIPQKPPMEIVYAFVDGYLLIGPSQTTVADAVHLHRSGSALAKSAKFLAALPPAGSLRASALFYEDTVAATSLQLRQFAPEIASTLAQNSKDTTPVVACVYGDEKTIRETSTSPSLDAGAALVVAAIAIPNLLRSKIAANEASALQNLRTLNTAELTYSATYPKRGFASNLSTLGGDPRGTTEVSQDHAGLLADTLVKDGCTADGWCTKDGYRFMISALCKLRLCSEYIAVATPVSDSIGTRSFCTTSDGVIRSKSGTLPASAPTASQCKTWVPFNDGSAPLFNRH